MEVLGDFVIVRPPPFLRGVSAYFRSQQQWSTGASSISKPSHPKGIRARALPANPGGATQCSDAAVVTREREGGARQGAMTLSHPVSLFLCSAHTRKALETAPSACRAKRGRQPEFLFVEWDQSPFLSSR